MNGYPPFPDCYNPKTKPHKFCPGCGHPLVLKMLGQLIDEMSLQSQTIFLIDIGCSLLAWDFYNVATSQTHHGRTIPTAVGFKMADPKKIVIAYMGDGGAYAIGLGHTLHAAIKNQPITTIIVNNTVYGMTGGQSSPTSYYDEITTTTPGGKKEQDMVHGPELLRKVAYKHAYLARGSSDNPLVLKQYLKRAIETQIKGCFSLVESLSYCPTNWKTSGQETINIMNKLHIIYKTGEY